MQKVIIMSVNPNNIKNILNKIQTILIRKNKPKCDYPIDVYLYCTKGKPYLYESFSEDWWWNGGVLEPLADRYGVRLSDFELPEKFHDGESRGWNKLLNGFIVAKFTLNKVDKIINNGWCFDIHNENGAYTNQIAKRSCFDFIDMKKYLNDKDGYAWHIDNLQIFDKSMELREFKYECLKGEKNRCDGCDFYYFNQNESVGTEEECLCDCMPLLKRPPQSWCYAYKEE